MFSYPPTFGIRVVRYPDVEPVQLGEAMEQCNIEFDDRHFDGWFNRNIPTARRYCEGYLGRALAQQTMELTFGGQTMPTPIPEGWDPALLTPWTDSDSVIKLPMGPINSVTYLRYVDGDGMTQNFTDYSLDTSAYNIYLTFGSSWPATQASRNAIRIRYNAGYTLPDDSPSENPLPPEYRSAMLLMLAHLFKNREATTQVVGASLQEIPLGIKDLMDLSPEGRLRSGFA